MEHFKPCLKCGGKGEIKFRGDFETHVQLCSSCLGSGVIKVSSTNLTQSPKGEKC